MNSEALLLSFRQALRARNKHNQDVHNSRSHYSFARKIDGVWYVICDVCKTRQGA